MDWKKSRIVLWLAILLLPPAGLVMVWMRRGGVMGKLAGSVVVALAMLVHLVYVFGMRFEARGDGVTPLFTFQKPEAQVTALEANRAQQKQVAVEEKKSAPVGGAEVAPAPVLQTGYWTDYRGPQRDGVYAQMAVRESWPAEGLKALWRQPVGGGYASFVAAGGRAYTIEQRREQEVVTAYDIRSGREVWAHGYAANFQESMGGDGPRATPAYQDGTVYALGATGELRVLDARTGALRWGKNILKESGGENLQWGMSAAPLVVDDKVIVQPGGKGAAVVAYDKQTGKKVWGVLDDRQAYTSPMVVMLGGQRQIVTVTATRMVGLEVETGQLLWEYPWQTQYDVNSAQPLVVGGSRVFISAGYGHGAALVEISEQGGRWIAKTVWENNRMKNKFSSSVVYEGHVYGLDENIFSCMRLSDGQQMWKGGRYGYGQLLLAGNRIVVITETGELVLIAPTPEKLVEVGRFQAIEGKTWNVPAIEDGVLLVRNTSEMAAFLLK